MSDRAADFSELVQARLDRVPARDVTAHEILAAEIARFPQPTDDHSVWWNARAWREAGVWNAATRRRIAAIDARLGERTRQDGWRLISRSDVFAATDDPLELFLATMAWGYGNRGYGWRRTADIVNGSYEPTIAHAVKSLRDAAATEGPASTWRAWSPGGEAKLRGLGTAFASKLAYFACFDRAGQSGPLIADRNTAWALWALSGCWDSRSTATNYARYVDWAQQRAKHLRCRPDDVERAGDVPWSGVGRCRGST